MTPEYEAIVRSMDQNCDPSSEAGMAAAVMLAALKVGATNRAVSAECGVPIAKVSKFGRRLRKGGVWLPNKSTSCNWMDPETGGIAFWCDVGVATGMLQRERP